MRVEVNEDCVSCGLCVDACPEVFELGDDVAKVIVDVVPEDAEECVRQAAEDCPSESIVIKEG